MKEEILKALGWRAAVKIYDPEKQVDNELVETIMEAGRMAPSAYGLQPYKVIHVVDKEIRAKLKEVAFGQVQVTDAPHLFIVAHRTDLDENFVQEYIENIVTTRGVTHESLDGFKKGMVTDLGGRSEAEKIKWASRQSYIALGFMLEAAAILGVDAGPMEGFNNAKVDEILNLKEKNLTSVGFMVLGYRGNDTYSQMKKVRASKENFFINY